MSFIDGFGNYDEYSKQLEYSHSLGFLKKPFEVPFEVCRAWKPRSHIDLLLKTRDFIYENKPVTVRNVYYRFESELLAINAANIANHGLSNREISLKNYHLTINMLTRARLSGFIKFDWIVDDTREPEKTPSWNNIEEIIGQAVRQYRSDWQKNQPKYVEVWLEKRTLRRIFREITDFYDLWLVTGGGYQSTGAIDDAAIRIRPRIKNGQEVTILYFGDLNPSGKDMPRDIKARLAEKGINVHMEEVSLNQDDVLKNNLPRNPTKTTDARCKWFAEKYPDVNYSVELDALPPKVLRETLHSAIQDHVDYALIEKCKAIDEQEKRRIKQQHEIAD